MKPSCSKCGCTLIPKAHFSNYFGEKAYYYIKLTCPRHRGDISHDSYFVQNMATFHNSAIFTEGELLERGVRING